MHECIIGCLHNYDNTNVVTLSELEEHIQKEKEYRNPYENWQVHELTDYCDMRKNTDLTRFQYCPFCGKKIDWKEIKKGGVQE